LIGRRRQDLQLRPAAGHDEQVAASRPGEASGSRWRSVTNRPTLQLPSSGAECRSQARHQVELDVGQ
jgi:hypothetical protein